jgi:hypothetical protein
MTVFMYSTVYTSIYVSYAIYIVLVYSTVEMIHTVYIQCIQLYLYSKELCGSASNEKDEMLLSLVGPDGLQVATDEALKNKLAHDQARQKLKSAEARSSPEYQAWRSNSISAPFKRNSPLSISIVHEKIEELNSQERSETVRR